MGGWDIAGNLVNLLSRFPFERLFIRGPDNKALNALEARLQEKVLLTGNPALGSQPLPNRPFNLSPSPFSVVAKQPLPPIHNSPQKTQEQKFPSGSATEEDTNRYQIGEIIGKIDVIDRHLASKCRIPQGQLQCDCCPNHLWGLREVSLKRFESLPKKESNLREITNRAFDFAMKRPNNLTLPLNDEEFIVHPEAARLVLEEVKKRWQSQEKT